MNEHMISGSVGHLFWLYVGPDQMMPVASILATIMGFLLIFWHKLLAMLRRIARLFRRSEGDAPSSSPSDAPAKKPLGKS